MSISDNFCRLDGRVALVTGGSRGIGSALCTALAGRGAAVVVHYNASADSAQAVADQITSAGGNAATVQGDLGDGKAITAMIEQAAAKLGEIDILVNNAAEMTDATVEEMTDEDWERSLSVNLTAAFRCARACLPAMKRKKWGRIINMSSQAAYNGSAKHAHYAATKSGLMGFTFSLAKEVALDGITVNLVAPGRIATEMVVSRMAGREQEWFAQMPMRRFGTLEEVANGVVFLASDEAAYITGTSLNISGGMLMG